MILSLFVILLAISLILIFLGYWTKEGLYYMIGFAFIFMLGIFVLLPGSLEIPAGKNTTATYSYDGSNIATITTVEIPTYAPMDNFLGHFFGFWITMLGIAGFIISITDIKRGIP